MCRTEDSLRTLRGLNHRRLTMATVTLRDENRTLNDAGEISAFLAPFGIWYRRFEGTDQLGESPTDQEILEAYKEPIEKLKAEGGYVTADVINIKAETP